MNTMKISTESNDIFSNFRCFLKAGSIMAIFFMLCSAAIPANSQEPAYPPRLPGGQTVVTFTSQQLLQPGKDVVGDSIRIARTAPIVDLFYFPGQDYAGKPWANWGDVTFSDGRFFATVDDLERETNRTKRLE